MSAYFQSIASVASQLSHLESSWSGYAECSPGGRWQQTSAGTKTSQEPLASWTLLVLITLREIVTRFVQSPELINYQFIINFDQIRYLCNEYLCLTELSFFYMLIISFSSLSSCEKGTNRVLLSKGSKLWRDRVTPGWNYSTPDFVPYGTISNSLYWYDIL